MGERTISGTRGEGQNEQKRDSDVFPSTPDRRKFSNTRRTNEFTKTGADTSNSHSANGNVHSLGGADDDHANTDESGPQQSDISTADQI
jgi:hypothetical protein